MSETSPPSPDLADVATLATALDWDAAQPAAQRGDFDRRTALKRSGLQKRSADARLWLEAACADNPALRALRVRFRANLQWASVGMLGLGLVLGVSTTLGAFFYTGADRVNVVTVLAVLVLLPGLLLLPFIWATIPHSRIGWIPGGQAAGVFFRGLNLGRIGWSLLQRLPQKWRTAWESMLHRADRHHALYANLQKWAVLRWSQMIALGFQVAALLTAGGLIVFSDLVFGWSTTLASGDPTADAQSLQTLTDLIATPWSWSLEQAAPSLELIRESRFYRAAAAPLTNDAAARLGQWWPFVLLAMLHYGLLPRLFTLWFSHARLRSVTRTAFELTPGLTSVLNRLHQAQVETTQPGTETRLPHALENGGETASLSAPPKAYPVAINWACVPLDEASLSQALGAARVLQAGGGASLAADREVIKTLLDNFAEGAVALVVKSWEPPLLELIDFLKELRQGIGPGREIVVMPIALNENDQLISVPAEALQVWQRQMHRANDPWLLTTALSPPEAIP